MRIVVLGASEFTIRCSEALADSGGELSALVSIPQHSRPNNSADTAGFAVRKGIPYYEIDDINLPDSVELIQAQAPDYVFCSWPKILKRQVLEVPRYYCIGTHPTRLPSNRGRHPLHWLIAQGIRDTALSFFRMDEGIDTGNLLLQVPIEINCHDTIADLDDKINSAGYRGTTTLYQRLIADPSYEGVKQEHALGNSWRKRTPHDITLDLRMPSSVILRTVRSFCPPYPCAILIFENHVLRIGAASVADMNSAMEGPVLQHIEPGKIISIEGVRIRVKADDAIVDLECLTPIPQRLHRAKYIHPPSKYLLDWPELASIFSD